jgi:selenocysteine lyase/cysteine desulfurase
MWIGQRTSEAPMDIGQYRDLFEVPDEIAYFNTGYNAPLLRRSREALERAASAKSRPWERTAADFFNDAETIRSSCAALFGGRADDYALIPAASYGISTAARILEGRLGNRDRVLLMEQEFPSNVLPWRRAAATSGAQIQTVARPHGEDWTSAILACLDPGVRVAALSACHWTDGSRVDLPAISDACKEFGTVLVLDMTQSLGAVPFDLGRIRPDFLVAAGYKWLLCPYGFGIMYVAEQWHGERPLEESWLARANSENFAKLVDYCDEYRPGARRFDVGETCVTTVLPGALAALDQIREWGVDNIFDLLRRTNEKIIEQIEPLGFQAPSSDTHCRHMFGVRLPEIAPADVIGRLSAKGIYLSLRGDAIRIAPHLHVTDADIERLVAALAEIAH